MRGASALAVTLTTAALAAAIRVGDSAEELAEVTRIHAYVAEVLAKHLGSAFDATPDAIVNEAAVRLCGFLYDQPTVSRGDSFAFALRSSGAARMLLPYVLHGAGAA